MGTLLVGVGIGVGLIAIPVIAVVRWLRKGFAGSNIGSDHP